MATLLAGCNPDAEAERPIDPDLAALEHALGELDDPRGAAATTLVTVAPEPLEELLESHAKAPLTEGERMRAETVDRPHREAVGRAELARARAELAATIAAIRAGRAQPRATAGVPPQDRADARTILIGAARYVVLDRESDPTLWQCEESVERERAVRSDRLDAFLRTVGKRRD